MRNKSVVYVVSVLAPLVFSFALALDLYIPTVPVIAHVMHSKPTTVQLTLGLFMLMQGLGQLFFGPLSDHFGRKPVAIVSSILFIVASILCGLSVTIDQLIAARIFEAAGACGMMVVAFAMVRDLFESDMSARVFSYLNSTIAVSPLLAPLVGAYMAVWLGWRSNFYLLAVIGTICLALIVFLMKETQNSAHKTRFNGHVFLRYWQIYRQPYFFPYVLMAGCAISVFFCFFSISPFIIIELLKVPQTHFGYYFAILGVVFLVGSMLAGKLTPKFGVQRILLSGALLVMFGGILMMLWYRLAGLSLSEFLVPVFFAGMGAAFMAGSGAALALERFPHLAGTAASLLGATQFMGSSLAASLMMRGKIVSTEHYAVTLVILGALSLVLYGVAQHARTGVTEAGEG